MFTQLNPPIPVTVMQENWTMGRVFPPVSDGATPVSDVDAMSFEKH